MIASSSVLALVFWLCYSEAKKICIRKRISNPVAANDFARDWYSYNETDQDFSMEQFSIAREYPGLKLYQTEQECGDGKIATAALPPNSLNTISL